MFHTANALRWEKGSTLMRLFILHSRHMPHKCTAANLRAKVYTTGFFSSCIPSYQQQEVPNFFFQTSDSVTVVFIQTNEPQSLFTSLIQVISKSMEPTRILFCWRYYKQLHDWDQYGTALPGTFTTLRDYSLLRVA